MKNGFRSLTFAVLTLLLVAVPASAQITPVVQVDVIPRHVQVGEPVTVKVTVLCPTFFPTPPRFPAGELANTITRLPENGTFATSETVNGESWSGIVYNYEIFPLLGATYRFSGESVAVTCAEPGTIQGTSVDVAIGEVVFRAVVPAGAVSLDPYLAGRDLTLERRIEGETESLEMGDALVVTYVAELDGLPAMFLPLLVETPEAPGVSGYGDQPVVEDGVPARRTEKHTFVFETGGEFVIPGASLRWWNRDTGQIEMATVEPLMVSVAGVSLPSPDDEPPPAEPVDWRGGLSLLILLAVGWRLLARQLPKLRAASNAALVRRLASEGHAFNMLKRALLGNDRRRAQRALLAWLERIAPGLAPNAFAERYGDETLREALIEASRTLYRESREDVQLKRLLVPLARARGRARREKRKQVASALPPLNPG